MVTLADSGAGAYSADQPVRDLGAPAGPGVSNRAVRGCVEVATPLPLLPLLVSPMGNLRPRECTRPHSLGRSYASAAALLCIHRAGRPDSGAMVCGMSESAPGGSASVKKKQKGTGFGPLITHAHRHYVRAA